ncbi:MAG TPA: LptE family protein [Terriglobales bacterium]|nr:LptE family protein [Terriglobales bacterium]
MLALIASSCGYSTAGHASRLPTDVRTIAIPAFVNKTQSYKIEQVLTAAVVREFTTRTNYHISNRDAQAADVTLHGTVVSAELAPLTYDSHTGRASSGLVTVTMKVQLVDKNGKVIFDNPDYVYREQYQISREVSSFFEEESPALDRMSRDFARSLVANVLEGF